MSGRRLRAGVAIALLWLSGCVSIRVDGVPQGASVFVDGQEIGHSPCRFKAKTIVGVSYEVVVHKQGYKDYKETVESEFDPYMLILLLSPLMVLIPFLGTVTPRHIYAQLEPDYGQTPPPDTTSPR
jgi:hypothetical protein